MGKLNPDYIEWVIKLNSSQAQDEYHKLEKANRELKKESDASRKALVELEKQGKKGSQEWKNLKNSIDQNSRTMADNRKKMEAVSRQFDQSSMTVNQLRKQLKDLTREFNNTSKASDPKRYKELQQQIQKTKQALNEATGSAKSFNGALTGLTKIKSAVLGFFGGIGSAIMINVVGSFRNAFKELQEFELENTKLAARLGTTKEGIKELTDAALKWEAATTYSATGVTQLQRELVNLGYSKDEVLNMTESIIMFAKISGADLPEAASVASSTLKLFNLEADATKDTMAILSAAVTTAGLDFGSLQSSLSSLGPVASQIGFSLEDTVAVLGMLQKSGLDASSAATATRNMLLKMVDPAGDLAKALGGPVKNANELVEGMKKLDSAGVDLAGALELSDRRTAALLQTFIQSGSAITDMKDAIDGAKSSFEETYQMMDDNVAGALANLGSAADSLVKQIASGTDGPLKEFINFLVMTVNGIKSVVIWIQEHGRWVKSLLAGLAAWKVTQLAITAAEKAWLLIVKAGKTAVAAYEATLKLASAAKSLFTRATEGATVAMNGLKAAMMSMPWGAIIGLVTSVISYFTLFKNSTDEAADSVSSLKEAEDEHARAMEECAAHIETEKNKLLNLQKVAADTTAKEEDRLNAIQALNSAIPGYNGHIDSTTGALVANTKALYDNIAAMEQRMRLAFYKDEYEKYLNEQSRARYNAFQAKGDRDDFLKNETTRSSNGALIPSDPNLQGSFILMPNKAKKVRAWGARNNQTLEAVKNAEADVTRANMNLNNFLKFMESEGVSVADFAKMESQSSVPSPSKSSGSIKTDKDKKKGTKKKAKKEKKKKEPAEKRTDKIKEATRNDNLKHEQNLIALEEERTDLSEEEYNIKKAQELIRYCEDLKKSLATLKESTKSTDKDLLDKIAEKEAKLDMDLAQGRNAVNQALNAKAEKQHEERLAEFDNYYEELERRMTEQVAKEEKVQEAADLFLLNERKEAHEASLSEMRRYYKEVEEADYLSAREKHERLEELVVDIKNLNTEILKDTAEFSAKMRELSNNSEGLSGIKNSYQAQIREINGIYEEAMKLSVEGSEEYLRLESERQRRLLVLQYEYQEELYRVRESIGLSWADEWERELLGLKDMHARGLIAEKDYQAKRLEIGLEYAKKYFDYYSEISGTMFQSIQDAEISMSEAKYDALIRQAENNGEDTASLEEEKENRKLEIQKKYADVNFAIKAGQIVADTAVSIMKAFADLGPIGGAIAAAILTATGAAQLIQANSEREKIKKLDVKRSSVSSGTIAPATATRVLSGFSEGGYTGDGGRYEVAGIVHRGEYVVPKPLMDNPRVVDAVGMIEAIRQQRRGMTAGFAEGGPTDGTHGVIASANKDYSDLISELRGLSAEMKESLRNVRAYIVFHDLERAKKNMDRAVQPFTK